MLAQIDLPEGMALAGAPRPGSSRRSAGTNVPSRGEPGRLVVQEQLEVKMARAAPGEYPAFGDSASAEEAASAAVQLAANAARVEEMFARFQVGDEPPEA